MKSAWFIFSFLLLLTLPAGAQEKHFTGRDFTGMGFREFAEECEALFPVKFFYRDEWVSDLKVGNYKGNLTVTDVLDSLFRGRSLYFYSDGAGNIVITKDYMIRALDKEPVAEDKYIPGIDYDVSDKVEGSTGNIVVDIGNPSDRNKPGNIILSGYITNIDTFVRTLCSSWLKIILLQPTKDLHRL